MYHFKAVIRKYASGEFLRGVAVISGGSAVAQAIPIMLTPLLTRLYAPDEMGMLGLYAAFVSFAASASTLGYSQAIVSAKSAREGASLASLAILIVMPMAFTAALVLLLLIRQGWLGFARLPDWAPLAMVLSLGLTGVYLTLRFWLVRVGAYREISTATISQSLARVVVQVLAGSSGAGWVGLLLGEITGRGAGLIRMWRITRSGLHETGTSLSIPQMKAVAFRYRKFPLLAAPSSLLNSISLVLPVPLITAYFGLYAAGQFSVASRVMLLPIYLIGGSVGDVFHNRIAVLSREHPEQAASLFAKVSGGLFAVGLLPLLGVSLYGEVLFAVVLGPNWVLAGSIAAAITPWALLQLAVSPVSRIVQVYQGQELKLIYDVLALISVGGALVLGDRQDWPIVRTCALLGWSQATVYAVYLLILVRILRKYKMINQEPVKESVHDT